MPPELIQAGNHILANTPDAWEASMRPIAGVQVKEVLGRRFSAEMQLYSLPRTSFFSLKLPSARVVVPDGSGFIGVTIITNGQMQTDRPKRRSEWSTGTAHVIDHDDRIYDFTSSQHLESLAMCFQKTLLQQYAQKFHGLGDTQFGQDMTELQLSSRAGGCFSRYANFLWEELNRGGDFLQSARATQEIEDSLWALLLSAIECKSGHPRRCGGNETYVRSAEEYIQDQLQASLRVADIAAAVGISVPTLNRAFRKCYGMGPKAFVKRKRLDQVRAELRLADPASTSVTEVATKYVFWHLSQFAADYKRAFYESPSDTLRSPRK